MPAPRSVERNYAFQSHQALRALGRIGEDQMQYLCIICAQQVMEQLEEADAREHFREYAEFTESIRRSGHFVAANRLLPPDTAVTVRVRDGRISTTDGPFAETKEVFGGYYLIEARDLNEAIHLASKIPPAALGSIEVRPIRPVRDEPRDAVKLER